jgi:hypothetical protein
MPKDFTPVQSGRLRTVKTPEEFACEAFRPDLSQKTVNKKYTNIFCNFSGQLPDYYSLNFLCLFSKSPTARNTGNVFPARSLTDCTG